MKTAMLFLVLYWCLFPVLALATDGHDTTVVSGGRKNASAKIDNFSSAALRNEYASRDARQKYREIKKPQTEEDIVLYGPRDLPSVMVHATRMTDR